LKPLRKEVLIFALVSFCLALGSGILRTKARIGYQAVASRKAQLEARRRELKKKLSDVFALSVAGRVVYTTDERLFAFAKTFPRTHIVSGSSGYYVLRVDLVTNSVEEAKVVLRTTRSILCPSENGKTCVFLKSLNPFELFVFAKES